MNDKASLRKKYRISRNEAKSSKKDDAVYAALCESEAFIHADTVFIYYPIKSEVDTLKIIRKALSDLKRVALPKCSDRNGNMSFYFVKDIECSLKEGLFSVKEPDTTVCEPAVPDEKSIFVVPGIAFDKKGCRLGYGGGYYDRFLSGFSGIKIGVCYEECLCDELPSDVYDVKVDIIITDKRIIVIK